MSLNIFSDEYGNVSGWQTKEDITKWIQRIKQYSVD
jgi:Mg2+/Co2+ transporter CorC